MSAGLSCLSPDLTLVASRHASPSHLRPSTGAYALCARDPVRRQRLARWCTIYLTSQVPAQVRTGRPGRAKGRTTIGQPVSASMRWQTRDKPAVVQRIARDAGTDQIRERSAMSDSSTPREPASSPRDSHTPLKLPSGSTRPRRRPPSGPVSLRRTVGASETNRWWPGGRSVARGAGWIAAIAVICVGLVAMWPLLFGGSGSDDVWLGRPWEPPAPASATTTTPTPVTPTSPAAELAGGSQPTQDPTGDARTTPSATTSTGSDDDGGDDTGGGGGSDDGPGGDDSGSGGSGGGGSGGGGSGGGESGGGGSSGGGSGGGDDGGSSGHGGDGSGSGSGSGSGGSSGHGG